jgi:hypothetical protein
LWYAQYYAIYRIFTDSISEQNGKTMNDHHDAGSEALEDHHAINAQSNGASTDDPSTLMSGERHELDSIDEPSLIFSLPIAAVISFAWRAESMSDEDLDECGYENWDMYVAFSVDHHEAQHHECDCPDDHTNIVINGAHVNTGLGRCANPELQSLSYALERYCRIADTSPSSAVILFDHVDGLFCNVIGFRLFFEKYEDYDIRFFMNIGPAADPRFKAFQLQTMLTTIRNCEQGVHPDTFCHQIVLEWVRISLDEECLAECQRQMRLAKHKGDSHKTFEDQVRQNRVLGFALRAGFVDFEALPKLLTDFHRKARRQYESEDELKDIENGIYRNAVLLGVLDRDEVPRPASKYVKSQF